MGIGQLVKRAPQWVSRIVAMVNRMFTAVLPPSSMIEELDELLRPRRDQDPRLRWTKPEGWHLTTAFMADAPDIERLMETLDEATSSVAPFTIRVGSGLSFPHPVSARLLGLGVVEGAEELGALAKKCRGAANHAGAAPDGAKFVGHLTLARSNRGIQATKWLGVLDSFPRWDVPVDEVALVQSHQTGKHYEVLTRFPLRGNRT